MVESAALNKTGPPLGGPVLSPKRLIMRPVSVYSRLRKQRAGGGAHVAAGVTDARARSVEGNGVRGEDVSCRRSGDGASRTGMNRRRGHAGLHGRDERVHERLRLSLASAFSRADTVVVVSRQRDGGQDGDDRDNDHQFDQGKALLLLHGVSPRVGWCDPRVATSRCNGPSAAGWLWHVREL